MKKLVVIFVALICVSNVSIAQAPGNSFVGTWRAIASQPMISGYVSLAIQAKGSKLEVRLLGQDQVEMPFTVAEGAIRGGRLEAEFAIVSPFVIGFMPGPVTLHATPGHEGPALDATLTDGMGRTHRLRFLPRDHASFRRFDVARLDPQGQPLSHYRYRVPVTPEPGLNVSTADAQGMLTSALEFAVDLYLNGRVNRGSSLLVLRNGRLLLEEYFHGMVRDRIWLVHSVSKSVTSVLAGIAVDRGETALDGPLNVHFPDYAQSRWMRSSQPNAVTLRHLLRMGNVIGWGDESGAQQSDAYTDPRSRFLRVIVARDWLGALFDYPVLTDEPDPYYNYNTVIANLAGEVVARSTKTHLSRQLQDRLMQPLGESHSWFTALAKPGDRSVEDSPALAGSLALMRPRAMAKIGQMMLDGGLWNGRRVVSAKWVQELTSLQALHPNLAGSAYGYYWWLNKVQGSDGSDPFWVITADGYAGQQIAIIPKYALVLVRTALDLENKGMPIGEFLTQHILPAVAPGMNFRPAPIEGTDLGEPTVRLPGK